MLWIRKHTRGNAYQKYSDEQLIQLYQQSGKEIFVAELFQRYVDKVYIIVRNYLVEREASKDLVMTIFEVVVSKLRYQQVDFFGNWIFTITQNECKSYLRNKQLQAKKFNAYSFFKKSGQKSVENDPFSTLINVEEVERNETQLNEAINSLKKHQQTCIRLFYFEKKSYKEIARITGYTDKEIKSYLQNAKKNLYRKLTGGEDEAV
ncbi:MAG: sigma-70 family RNA polymerase sigma factor [Bacteroidota bacterium]